MNWFLSSQYGLHDLCVELRPIALSQIRRLQRCMRILSWEHQDCDKFPCTFFPWSCKALLLASELPTFSARFFGFFELFIHCINDVSTAQSSSVVKLRFFDSPFFLLFVALLLTYCSISLATTNQALMSFVSSSTASRTMYAPLEIFLSIRWTVWVQSTNLIGLGLLRHSNNRPYGAQASHPKSYLLLLLRRCIVMELGMILLSARTVWLGVQRDGGIWSFSWHGPEIVSCFTIIRRWVLIKCWWRPVWFSKKSYLFFSSFWTIPD